MVADQEKRPPSRNLGAALGNLAQVYAGMGRAAEAEQTYKRGLAVMEKAIGLDSNDIVPELSNLGALYERQAAMPRPNRCLSARLRFAKKRFRRAIPTSGWR